MVFFVLYAVLLPSTYKNIPVAASTDGVETAAFPYQASATPRRVSAANTLLLLPSGKILHELPEAISQLVASVGPPPQVQVLAVA